MMNVAAYTSVGRGPSDARPEHFRRRGYRNIIVFKGPLAYKIYKWHVNYNNA